MVGCYPGIEQLVTSDHHQIGKFGLDDSANGDSQVLDAFRCWRCDRLCLRSVKMPLRLTSQRVEMIEAVAFAGSW
jgi:hypothetical protein